MRQTSPITWLRSPASRLHGGWRHAVLALALFGGSKASAQRGDAPDTKLLPAEQQQALFRVPPGFEVQLVASEPDIQKPMNLAFDAGGRVWVTGSTLYPWPARRDALDQPIAAFQKNWDDNSLAFRATSAPPEPAEQGADSVRILSDFDSQTGRARKVTVFADKLNIPIGVLPLPRRPGAKGDAALVFSIPAIWRLTDTDGDGRADVREKLYDGFGFRDTHGMSSSYWLWFDGWVYGTHGYSNISEVVDRQGNTTRLQSGNTYRFRPDGSRFELYVRGQTNPFGLAFDHRGDLYTADSHSRPVTLLIPGGYYDGMNREHDGLGYAPFITSDDHGSSAIAGVAHYSAAQYPEEYYGNVFNGNPVTRRVNRARLDWRGSSPAAVRVTDFVTCEDRAFRPVQVRLGPDGALWIADFYNPIIGHYEVPLTHPGRDRTHGRVWRVVWRGLDRSLPSPALPDLSRDDPAALVHRLGDANLVVRSLAASELFTRPDVRAAVPLLRERATQLINGTANAVDDDAALAVLMTLERLDRSELEPLLGRAMQRPDSNACLAALRVLTNRNALPAAAESWIRGLVGTGGHELALQTAAPGHVWRAVAELLRQHPQPWGAPLLLGMQERAPSTDPLLVYALRLALKTHALTAELPALRAWSAASKTAAERAADVCVAVPTPAAAEFLLEHLERTKFAGTRAGEFARHAVQQLRPEEMEKVLPLLRSLEHAPLAQRVALAEGLASVASKPRRTLPAEAEAWMRRELIAGIEDKDSSLALRAINAVRPLAITEKAAPLRTAALDRAARENVRTAAVRALDPKAAETEATLVAVLESNASHQLRRTAADLLGNVKTSPRGRAALAEAFATASADLALTLANTLAKSDAGAAELLELVEAGRVRASLLRHRYLTLTFEKRPAELRARVAALTQSLPPENARLDAVIAQRVGAAAAAEGNPVRGAALYAMHCAACHRFRDTGGNLGPSLDGIAARSLPRLIEDILDPSRNVDPAFRLTSVTLKSGETKAGLNLREQSDRVILSDAGTGQEVVIPRADIASVAPSPDSPMPAAFETMLSEHEFFDLLEYLRRPAK